MIIMMMTVHALTIMTSSVSGASDYKQCRCTFSNPAKRGEMGENKWYTVMHFLKININTEHIRFFGGSIERQAK